MTRILSDSLIRKHIHSPVKIHFLKQTFKGSNPCNRPGIFTKEQKYPLKFQFNRIAKEYIRKHFLSFQFVKSFFAAEAFQNGGLNLVRNWTLYTWENQLAGSFRVRR